jgi:YVTN family beta-propeller protein
MNRLVKQLCFALVAGALVTMPAHVRALGARPMPGCSAGVARYDVALPGHPYSAVSKSLGGYAFVSIDSSSPASPTGIAVLRCVGGRYRYSHIVRLESQPTGIAMTRDGTMLVVADDGYVAFVDTSAAIASKPAILGYIQDLDGDPEDNDPGSAYVNVSSDDRFAFVSDEQNDTITVIDLARTRRSGFSRAAIVGAIPVANAPIALTFSRDGRYLFTTSEIARKSYGWPTACRPEGAPPDAALENAAGAIITVDVAKATTAPAQSVIGKIPANCSPVRMAISPDGSTVWVTNRGSNTVTAYSTAHLIAGDARALVATVRVGSNPVAIAVSSDGRYILVGNTNRFGPGGTSAGTVSVIDAATNAIIRTIPVGNFPREFSHGSGSTLFLANYRSNTLTVFDTALLLQP